MYGQHSNLNPGVRDKIDPNKAFGCTNCRLKEDSLFKYLNHEDLIRLNQNRYTLSFESGELICKSGSKPLGLLCLKSGKAKITKLSQSGNEQIVAFKKPVDFIGLRSIMLDDQIPVSVTAIEHCQICVLNKDDLFTVLRNNHGLMMGFLRHFAQELKIAENRLSSLTQKHMRARLADGLLHLLTVFGLNKDGETLNIHLKRTELASLSNMSTSNAIRVLSAFANEDLIQLEGKEIKILQPLALKSISILGC